MTPINDPPLMGGPCFCPACQRRWHVQLRIHELAVWVVSDNGNVSPGGIGRDGWARTAQARADALNLALAEHLDAMRAGLTCVRW